MAQPINQFVYKSSAKKEPLTSWWFFPQPIWKKKCGSQIGSWNPNFRGEHILKNIWVAKPPSGKDCANFGAPMYESKVDISPSDSRPCEALQHDQVHTRQPDREMKSLVPQGDLFFWESVNIYIYVYIYMGVSKK